jgi:hypothetical protein
MLSNGYMNKELTKSLYNWAIDWFGHLLQFLWPIFMAYVVLSLIAVPIILIWLIISQLFS